MIKKIIRSNFILIKFILILAIFFNHFYKIDDTPPRIGAEGDNFVYSYNLAKHNVYTKSKLDNQNISPDAFFLPLVPIINTFIIGFDKNLSSQGLECYLSDSEFNKSILKYMKLYNFISLIVLIYFSYKFSRKYFGENISYIIILLFLSLSWYHNILNSFKHELLASALFMGWLYCKLIYQNNLLKKKYSFFSAIFLGLLILTRSFFTILIIFEIYFLFHKFEKKNLIVKILSLLLIFCILYPWKNYQKSISQEQATLSIDLRGGKLGAVMAIRAEKNQMDLKEYIGGFFYFAPSGGARILNKFFDYEYYERWERKNLSSFHKRMMEEDSFIKKRLKEKKLDISDKNLFKESFNSFIEQPVKHFFTSILFMYRGFWPDATDRISLFIGFFSFPFFIIFFIHKLFDKNFRKQNLNLLILLTPCIFSILFHSVFTHYQPRYSIPIMAPILVFYFGYILNYFSRKFRY